MIKISTILSIKVNGGTLQMPKYRPKMTGDYSRLSIGEVNLAWGQFHKHCNNFFWQITFGKQQTDLVNITLIWQISTHILGIFHRWSFRQNVGENERQTFCQTLCAIFRLANKVWWNWPRPWVSTISVKQKYIRKRTHLLRTAVR